MAAGTTVGTSTVEAPTVISGRLRPTGQTLGTVYCMVVTLESSGQRQPSKRFFSSLRSGLKAGACGGA